MHERLPETTTSTRNYRFNGGLHDHCTKDYQRLPNNCSKRMRCCTSYTFRKEWSESVEIRASRLLFSAAPRTSSLFTRREILLLKLYKGNGWSGILKGFIASVVFCWASWRSAFSRIRENVDQRASRRIPKKRLQKKKHAQLHNRGISFKEWSTTRRAPLLFFRGGKHVKLVHSSRNLTATAKRCKSKLLRGFVVSCL